MKGKRKMGKNEEETMETKLDEMFMKLMDTEDNEKRLKIIKEDPETCLQVLLKSFAISEDILHTLVLMDFLIKQGLSFQIKRVKKEHRYDIIFNVQGPHLNKNFIACCFQRALEEIRAKCVILRTDSNVQTLKNMNSEEAKELILNSDFEILGGVEEDINVQTLKDMSSEEMQEFITNLIRKGKTVH